MEITATLTNAVTAGSCAAAGFSVFTRKRLKRSAHRRTRDLDTGLAVLIGPFLVTNYGLATPWMSPGQQDFHLVLFVLMLAFFFARAGHLWGLDGWLARSNPRSRLTRRPIS